MSNRTLNLTDTLYDYVLQTSLRESPVQKELRLETAKLPLHQMQIAPEQGQLMGVLLQLTGAKRVIELGTYTGYSALSMALALPDDGTILTCDIDEKTTSLAKQYWQKAGVMHKIDLCLAPAIATLDTLLAEGKAGYFDWAFIDADKENYPGYYERLLSLVKPGGGIMIDNTLWDGQVADPTCHDAATEAIRTLNKRVHTDERVTFSLLPIADGLTIVRKK